MGAAILRSNSPALSTNVVRLAGGSGTVEVSGPFGSLHIGVGCLQPEGLCFIVEGGGGMALRALMPDSCSSPRGRECDDAIFGTCDGSFRPEGFE